MGRPTRAQQEAKELARQQQMLGFAQEPAMKAQAKVIRAAGAASPKAAVKTAAPAAKMAGANLLEIAAKVGEIIGPLDPKDQVLVFDFVRSEEFNALTRRLA